MPSANALRIVHGMTVKDFLESIGGPARVATDLDLPLTTVASWQQRNKIPNWRRPALAALADKRGLYLPTTFGEPA